MATFATQLLDQVWAWVESRRAVSIVLDWWLTLLDALGPVAGPVDAVVDAVAGVLGNLDDLVVIPLAWLTVGRSSTGTSSRHRPARAARTSQRRGSGCPAPVRRWTTEAAAPVVGDVRGPLHGAHRRAAPARGRRPRPMLVFALAFLVATRRRGSDPAARPRAVSGPQDVDTWLAFAPMVSSVATAVGLTVTMALLAAGVDRILAGQAAAAAQEPVAADA